MTLRVAERPTLSASPYLEPRPRMTLTRQSRTALDRALGLPRDASGEPEPSARPNVVLLLFGSERGPARDLHDTSEATMTQPWRRTFLVTDASILTASEWSRWGAGEGRYAVHKVDGDLVPTKGEIAELQLVSGRPSRRKLRGAFAHGEQA